MAEQTLLTEIGNSFVSHDKLAVLGRAGKSSAVYIFDLQERRLIDWYFCIEPKKVSSDWIVYVEWHPRLFGSAAAREVVLLHDLKNDPRHNRLPSPAKEMIPVPITAAPVEVGEPIYPEENVKNRSYRNVLEDSPLDQTVMSNLSFLMLPNQRLVSVAASGGDFPSSRNWLVVIDLSRGVEKPFIETLEIPKDKLQEPGENPKFIKINAIEMASENSVRVLLPATEYGISSIVVPVP